MAKTEVTLLTDMPKGFQHGRRPSLLQRSFGTLTTGGVRQSMFTLISAAIGGGILCLPYVMSLAGIFNGILLLLLASFLAFVSIRMLLLSAARTGIYSYGRLFAHASNFALAAPLLDVITMSFGFGIIIAYFVFLGDFLPPVADILGVSTNRNVCIAVCCLLSLPFAVPYKLSALQYITPVSTISLVVTACVVAYQSPAMHASIPAGSEELDYMVGSLNLFKCFAIAVSAFICHTNVVSVAGELVDPTHPRATKIASRAAIVQLVFYLLISVCGYVSFGKLVEQNFIKNYSDNNTAMAVCRVLLSVSIFFGLPLNTNPTARSFVNLALRFVPEDQMATPLLPMTPSESTDPLRKLRIASSFSLLVVGAILSLFIPGIADVVSILGGSFGTLIMLVFPAMIYMNVFRDEMKNRGSQLMVGILLVAAMCCFVSVAITLFGTL